VLRRVNKGKGETVKLSSAKLEIDEIAHSVHKADQMVDLTPSEFEILLLLARNPGRVFTRLQLLDAMQGQAYEGYERTVDAHIKNLRAKIEEHPRNPVIIKTVFGVGYKLAADNE
jgi:DNA-binding response OmpR family regulator